MPSIKGRQRYLFVLFALLFALGALMATFAGCSKKSQPYHPPVAITPVDSTQNDSTTADTTAKSLKYLALGDSYTFGQSIPDSERFPMQLAVLLTAAGLPADTPTLIARTGWTTLDLLNAIDGATPSTNNDIVTLLIGVNDEYQMHDTTNYRQRFTRCLDKAVQLAGGKRNHVFVVSIPDYSVTPFGGNSSVIAAEIDLFNAINNSVSQQYGISYTDVTVISRNVQYDNTMICSDGLHPSGKQYRLWALKIAKAILTQLK